MYKFNYIAFFACLCLSLYAEGVLPQPAYLSYDWAIEPPQYEPQDGKTTTILRNYKQIEYSYNQQGELNCYETTHKIVYVDSDLAVELYNKVYISVADTASLVRIKARAISPDKGITNFDKKNIKSIATEDIGTYKIFAIDGVVKGGIVEYLYTTRTDNVDLYGRETLQTDYPTQNAILEILSPPNLIFEAKSYNGFPSPIVLETDSLRTLRASFAQIPALTEEAYSTPRSNYMRVDYKLSYNKNYGIAQRLFDWKMASKHFGGLVVTQQDKSTTKAISQILKKLNLNKLSSEEKIISIENHLKTTISLQEGNVSADIPLILQNQYTNEIGMCRILAAFLQAAQIPFQLVVTSDRTKCSFDPEFEAWNSFTDILFYFPKTNKFIAPNIFFYRYGAAPEHLANNYGLFIDPSNYGHKIDLIPIADSNDNISTIRADIDFSSILNPKVEFQQEWFGYRAITMRTAYNFQKENILTTLATASIEDTKPTDIVVNNDQLKDNAYLEKPFVITANFNIKRLIEKAGNNYLFKIGEMIGAQTELYQNHERQNPIDMDYPITYRRTITFEIPKGYTLKGLDDTRIDHSVEENNKKINRFESGYTLKDNKVTIFANEYYEQTHLLKEKYDTFRKVINAAADFNKIVLVFEKQP